MNVSRSIGIRIRAATRIAVAALCLASLAQAQAGALVEPTRLPALGRSAASVEDTTALVANPANLAFLPGAELRWSLALFDDSDVVVPWQGHALGLGFPIPVIPLSTGFRVDFLNPPEPVPPAASRYSNYQWFTWGLAARASRTTSLGFSWQRSYSESTLLHGLSAWSFGLSTRPSDYFGLAFVAADVNSPRTDAGGGLDRSYDIAVAVHPLGSRALEVSLEGKYVDEFDRVTGQRGYWVPRATVGLDLPFGRLRGEFEVRDAFEDVRERAYLGSALLSVYLNAPGGSAEFGVGSVFGNALGQGGEKAYRNLLGEVAFRGFREPVGIDAEAYALRLRIEDTPGTREHVALLRRLWSIAEEEPTVSVVVLELRSAPAASLARAQELRDAIAHLQASGKRVLCHLESGSGTQLYVCAAADRILINPAGGLRVAGLSSTHFYIAGLLEKLGIRAEFVRIGAHKSAPEMFVRRSATDTARADKIDLLQQFERYFTGGVAAGRRLDVAALRASLSTGPFVAQEAKAAGLVDGFAFDDELEEKVSALVGHRLQLIDDERAPRAREHLANTRGIAIVYVDGDMVDGRSQTIPFMGMRLAGSYTIADSIKEARENPAIGAVVLRIETGGGSAMAADVIWREVALTTAIKPVIVSMGSSAASGGYYIAAPGTRIFANPLTVTGSIGIFYGKADVHELFRKLGVNVEVHKTASRADAESIFRPFTDEERKELRRKVGQFYGTFLDRVARGRKLTTTEVDAVGRGRVWTGAQAKQRGLVDELGGLRQALAYARALARLPDHAPITELPVPETSIIGRLLGIEGLKSETLAALPAELRELALALGPFVVHPPDVPLARSELVTLGTE